MGKKIYDDDDGRTIADMSGLEGRSITSAFKETRRKRKEEKLDPEIQADKKTRRSYTLGAVGAGLLIGSIYLIVFAIVIVFLLFIWGVL